MKHAPRFINVTLRLNELLRFINIRLSEVKKSLNQIHVTEEVNKLHVHMYEIIRNRGHRTYCLFTTKNFLRLHICGSLNCKIGYGFNLGGVIEDIIVTLHVNNYNVTHMF